MNQDRKPALTRRDVLRAGGAAGLSLPWAARLRGGQAAVAEPLPGINLFGRKVSRLIAGTDPVWGLGHATPRLGELMAAFFTPARTVEFLMHCEELGINAFESVYRPQLKEVLDTARQKGSKIQFIGVAPEAGEGGLKELLALKPAALAYAAGGTDAAFREGKRERVRDFVKKVKDAGVPAGISTESPENLVRIEDAGWEHDFYLASLYYVGRFTPEEMRERVGDELIQELYIQDDPPQMLKVVRQVKKPCLVYKVLAAGRLCATPETIEGAFEVAYRGIKPSDAAIVGMYPVYVDEVQANADLARKLAGG